MVGLGCGVGLPVNFFEVRHLLTYQFHMLARPIWLADFRFGPLEWLWRSLTYGVRQPMRRIAGAGNGDP